MISFYLEADSGLPTYVQLIRQVEHAIRLGRLRPGDQLPSVREVVAGLAINPNTVSKAYRELENRGLLDIRQGVGTFIKDDVVCVPPAAYANLSRKMVRWVNEAKLAGMSLEDVRALIDSVLRQMFAEAVA